MPTEEPPRTIETAASSTRICQLLNLPDFGQDWDLCVSDPERIAEFCDLYESGELNDDERFGLMKLIVASVDDLVRDNPHASHRDIVEPVDGLLHRDFLLHFWTVMRWSVLDESEPDAMHAITPMMRQIWQDNFRPEHDKWLAAYRE